MTSTAWACNVDAAGSNMAGSPVISFDDYASHDALKPMGVVSALDHRLDGHRQSGKAEVAADLPTQVKEYVA